MRIPSTVEPEGATWKRQARVLREAAIALTQAGGAAGSLDAIVGQIARLDGFRLGQAFLASGDQKQLTLCSSWHAGSPELEAFVERSRDSDAGRAGSLSWAALRDRSTHIANTPDQPFDPAWRVEAAAAGLSAGFAIPVLARDRVVAILEFHRREPIPSDDSALVLAEALAAQLGTVVALRMAEMERERLAEDEREARRRAEEAREELASVQSILDQVHAPMPTLAMVQKCTDVLRGCLRVDAVAAYGVDRPSGTAKRLALSCASAGPPPGDLEMARAVSFRAHEFVGPGPESPGGASGSDTCSVYGVPLVVESERIGALIAFHRGPFRFTAHHRRIARITAERIAPRVSRAWILEEAWRDRMQLEALSRRLLTAREIERREISRDLHDEVGQVIAALKFSMEATGDRSEGVRLALASLMQQIRSLSQRFRPPMLDDMGLVPTLEWHVRQFSNQTGIRVRFRSSGAAVRCHPDLEIALYRVVQEALTNVARHARAAAATVVLRVGRGRIQLRVRDHGVGFDPDRISPVSTGFVGMKERLRPLGGQIIVQSRRGRGTRVTATAPFHHEGTTMTDSITVVIADDHRIVREALKALLESASFEVLGEAGDGLEAVSVAERLKPNVLLLDVAMPGLGGVDVVKQVVKRSPRTQTLMLSMYANDTYVNGAVKNGACGYVLKDASASELFHAIREAAAGRRYLSKPLEESGVVDRELEDTYDSLTMREREVFHLAAEGLTSAQIADRLSISPRTAETHRANSLRKLGIRGQTELVRYAIGRGILPAPV